MNDVLIPAKRNAGLLTGAAFALLWLGGSVWQGVLAAPGAFPRPTDPMAGVQAYLRASADALKANGELVLLSGVALIAFAAAMAAFLRTHQVRRRGAADLVLAGGIAAGVLQLAGAATSVIIATSDLGTDAASTQLLYQLTFWFAGPLHVAALGVLMAAMGYGLGGLLPRWLNGFGLTVGIAAMLASLSALLPFAMAFIPLGRFAGFAYLLVTTIMLAAKRFVAQDD